MLAVAGCQSGDKGVLGIGGGGSQQAKVEDTRVKASDLMAYCPTITLRDGTAYFNTYANGAKKKVKKADDAEADAAPAADAEDQSANIVYQAAITDVTRDCARNAGTLTMNVAVAGKVVPGPKATAGSITMPIRIAVLEGSQVIYSQLHQYKLQVTDMSAATQFVFSDPNVSVPEPSSKNYQVFAGYDEGPPAKKKK
ncbi:MAG TPA: hypothetical protein VGM46_10240 [Mesorhizobium sp.]